MMMFPMISSGASAFKGGAAKYKGVAAVLDDDLGFGVTVGAGDPGHRCHIFVVRRLRSRDRTIDRFP
jgi:hypothetical protein